MTRISKAAEMSLSDLLQHHGNVVRAMQQQIWVQSQQLTAARAKTDAVLHQLLVSQLTARRLQLEVESLQEEHISTQLALHSTDKNGRLIRGLADL